MSQQSLRTHFSSRKRDATSQVGVSTKPSTIEYIVKAQQQKKTKGFEEVVVPSSISFSNISTSPTFSSNYPDIIKNTWEDENDNVILRKFDLNPRYGPSIGISRQERWQRAKEFGLDPPEEVRQLLEAYQNQKHSQNSSQNKGTSNSPVLADLLDWNKSIHENVTARVLNMER